MNIQFSVQVPHTPEIDKSIERLKQKLNPLLITYQPDLIQLHGRVLYHKEREGAVCSLDLRLPSQQMATEETAETAQEAMHAAGDELLRQVRRHMQKLRDIRVRDRWNRRSAAVAGESAMASPKPDGADHRLGGPAIAGYLSAHQLELIAFVERQIERHERFGDVQPGQLDPREVLDEIVVRALGSESDAYLLNRNRWMTVLAAESIRSLVNEYGDHHHGQQLLSLDQPPPGKPAAGTDAQFDEEDELTAGRRAQLQDSMAGSEAGPEEVTYTDEIIQALENALLKLPAGQRHDLALCLLEGFDANELALISNRTPDSVRHSLEEAAKSLNQLPNLPDELRTQLKRSVASHSPAYREHYG